MPTLRITCWTWCFLSSSVYWFLAERTTLPLCLSRYTQEAKTYSQVTVAEMSVTALRLWLHIVCYIEWKFVSHKNVDLDLVLNFGIADLFFQKSRGLLNRKHANAIINVAVYSSSNQLTSEHWDISGCLTPSSRSNVFLGAGSQQPVKNQRGLRLLFPSTSHTALTHSTMTNKSACYRLSPRHT